MDERTKAVELRRQAAERWAHARLIELATALVRLGVPATVDWGRTAWEPCLLINTGDRTEVVWCRPVAVRLEAGRPVYRWRLVWNEDPRLLHTCTHPAADVARAAHIIAAYYNTGGDAETAQDTYQEPE